MQAARRAACAWLAVAACAASGQALAPPPTDWQELDTPPPPAFHTDSLIPLETPRQLSLRFGVDADTLRIDRDGVVRMVVVASSSGGAVNAMYEGIRCLTGEYKIHARHVPGSGWNTVKDAQWRSVFDGALGSHALVLARSGVCRETVVNGSVQDIVRDLKGSSATRFGAQP
ncbi:MAG: CNP1-like family protein [Burkholderiaceae bacterium]|nr:CNP1-like family protein [Burkholderiaceae bacterium]MDO9090473.1 CNP1-like family protein [Burkholderiaceae bacterium]MDP1968006.1 CNP1-like family protein [Burkholderiaceae bacterium]